MTKKKRYKRYSPEFKREALMRAGEEGATDTIVCEELDISPRQLRRWRDEFRLLGDDAFPGQGKSRDEWTSHIDNSSQAVAHMHLPPSEDE
jgi:transposase